MTALPLPITILYNNQSITLYPSVLREDKTTFLVDCGYEGSLPVIAEQLEKYNLSVADLTGIILSHDDIDHVGGLYELMQAHPALKIHASEIEASYLSGGQKSLRLQQAEDLMATLPDEHKPWALEFQNSLRAIKRLPVDVTLAWDEVYSESLRIINTPGHTPGHISLYLPESKTLIANDAVVIEEDGSLKLANPSFALDLKQAVESVQKLAQLDIARMVCYHGGVVEGAIPEKLAALAQKYEEPVV
jgi:glyoxylase-like metal-dependent hydrolase (beta-lactamase superfamily II)